LLAVLAADRALEFGYSSFDYGPLEPASGSPRLGGSVSSLSRRQSPAARRAASSICAEPKTRTIAATVAVSFAGSVNVGRDGHLIIISGEVSGRWTSSTTSRSDWLTSPTAKNRSESLDGEWSTRLRFATSLSFP